MKRRPWSAIAMFLGALALAAAIGCVRGGATEETNHVGGGDTSGNDATSSSGRPSPRACALPTSGTQLATGSIGGDAEALTIDAAENLYVGGMFKGRLDVGATAHVETPSTPGNFDGFVLSFAPNGAVRWSRTIGNSMDGVEDVTGMVVVGDLILIWGTFTKTIDLHVRSAAGGERAPFEAGPFANGFLAALRASDGTTAFAQQYRGIISDVLVASATEVFAIVSPGRGENMGCSTPTSGALLIARLDTSVLTEDPTNGALAPSCMAATRLADGFGAGVAAMSGSGGDLFVASGASPGIGASEALGTMPIARPTSSTSGTLAGFVARIAPDLTVRWVRGFDALPHPARRYPSVVTPRYLRERDGALVLTGYVIGAANLGTGTVLGTGENATDIFVAGIDADTGTTSWSQLYANPGSDLPTGLFLDRGGQIQLLGSFDGPGFDLSGGAAPLSGRGQLFVATLSAQGAHQCSRASAVSSLAGVYSGSAPTAAATPRGDAWFVIGNTRGSIDLGTGMIGDASSNSSSSFVQRFSFEE